MNILEISNSNPEIIFINWDKRQFKSDDSYSRVKRFRNVTETPPDTDTDTDTEKKKEDKKEKVTKEFSGEFKNVWMTPEQHTKLVEKVGTKQALKYIENLSQYMASKGKRYKCHYATILQWSRRDRKTGDSYGIQ